MDVVSIALFRIHQPELRSFDEKDRYGLSSYLFKGYYLRLLAVLCCFFFLYKEIAFNENRVEFMKLEIA